MTVPARRCTRRSSTAVAAAVAVTVAMHLTGTANVSLASTVRESAPRVAAITNQVKVPDPLPAGAPGSIISSTRLSTSPPGAIGYRIVYQSRAVDDRPIAVSGLAYIPTGKAPKNGWPVLSWAHGTTGLADKCAPSTRPGLLENALALGFTRLGIAVVATDYEGLGTPGRHPYLVGVSEGRGVLDAVRALRALRGKTISNRFAVWGHSQGGHAALFAGELAATYTPELQLVGVVAGAPPSQLSRISDALAGSRARGYVLMVVAGLAAADPLLDPATVLGPKGLEALPRVDTGCTESLFAAANRTTFDQLVQPGALAAPQWAAALAANEPGQVRTAAPILIVHGDRDEIIPVETSETLRVKLCALGNRVQRNVYAGQDHTGAALGSLLDVSAWILDRFANRPAATGCA